MKTKTILLKTGILAFFLLMSNVSWAAVYYTCIGTSLNLTAGNLPAGTTALWDVKKDGAQFPGYPSATAPGSFSAAGSYEVILVSLTSAGSGQCASDPVINTINVLPPLALTLGTPSIPAYCAEFGTTISSNITPATTGTVPAYSTDLELSYTYSVVKDTDAPVDGLTVGEIDPNGVYKLTTRAPGVYKITASVKYKQTTTNTANLLLGTGCPVNSAGLQTVTVTPKPGQPTISITAAP